MSSQASRALIHYVPFGYLFIHSTAFIGHQQRTCPGVRGFQAHPCYSGVGLIIIMPRPPHGPGDRTASEPAHAAGKGQGPLSSRRV